jgi:hypothetical protein
VTSGLRRKRPDSDAVTIADKYCRRDGSPLGSLEPLGKTAVPTAADLERALRNVRSRLTKGAASLWLKQELDLIHDALWAKGCVTRPREEA